MRYMLLIYGNEQASDAMTPDEMQAYMQAWFAYSAALGQSGKLLSGDPLDPTATATTIRPNGQGGTTVTDGPFAETKEQLSGYYIIEADDLDDAIAWAARMPNYGQPGNGVEVRPVMHIDL